MDGKSLRISFADMQKSTGCEREERQVVEKSEPQLSEYLNRRADNLTDFDSQSDSKSASSNTQRGTKMTQKWRTTTGIDMSLERVEEVMNPLDEFSNN